MKELWISIERDFENWLFTARDILEEAEKKRNSIIKTDEIGFEILDSRNMISASDFLIISSIEISNFHNNVRLPVVIALCGLFLLDRIPENTDLSFLISFYYSIQYY